MNPEKWYSLGEYVQLANIGSAFSRAAKGSTSYDEFLDLLDCTISDPKWRDRTKEFLMLREIVGGLTTKTGTYEVSVEQLNDYFLGFSVVARKGL